MDIRQAGLRMNAPVFSTKFDDTVSPMHRQTPRHIAHLDMDAFFASVELLRYPELRGVPVVIGGGRAAEPRVVDGVRVFARLRDYVGRGVASTATYEARALGVFSAMGLMKAAALAPDAVLLPVDFAEYRRYSRAFKAAVLEIAPQIEDYGIDEIFIDLTGAGDTAVEVARRIKTAVFAATGLRCSIGLAANKLLAKIASELSKPDGFLVLRDEDVQTRLWPLPARTLHGVGPKSAARLADLGIHTVGELAQAAPERLQAAFGLRYARWLLAAAHGQDERPLITESEPKSISRETTFARDLHARHDKAALSAIFDQLCLQVAADLKRKGYAGRTVGIKLRFEDFRTVTRDCTLPAAVTEAAAIRRAAGLCLKRVDLTRRLRLLGVRVGGLEHAQGVPVQEVRQLALGEMV